MRTYDTMTKAKKKKRVNIKIRPDQYRMIKNDESLKFSGWVRDMIDKELIRKKGDKK